MLCEGSGGSEDRVPGGRARHRGQGGGAAVAGDRGRGLGGHSAARAGGRTQEAGIQDTGRYAEVQSVQIASRVTYS